MIAAANCGAFLDVVARLSKNDARRKLKGCAVKSGERGENGRSGGGRRRNQTASVGQGLAVGSPVYNELVQFLHEEAGYLDDLEFDAWAELLAEDLVYVAPLRSTRAGRDRHKSIDRTMFHFEIGRAHV